MRHLSLTLLTAAFLPLMAADPAPAALFDGKTLTGWEGNTAHWTVQDGAITGTIPAGTSLEKNEFIWWNGEVADFELTLEYRITGHPSANSGIQYRSEREANGHGKGYQADLDHGDTWLGRIYDEHGRALLTERGQRVAIAPDGRKWTDTFAPLDGFKAVPKRGEWNRYKIRATASHVTVWVNDTLMTVLDDRQANAADFAGKLAFQLHSGPGPAVVQFRNVQITNLGKTEFTHNNVAQAAPPAGMVVNGDDGKPLNLDLEKGSLDGWTATGDAWYGQPIEGDTVTPRKPGQASRHAGKFWVGGYERSSSDSATGTLTSPVFTVTKPWASFLVGGGKSDQTRVELIDENGAVVFKASGEDAEDMRRISVDLGKLQGKKLRLRLVDEATGGWGHLNFDDFVFHDQRPGNAPTAAAGGGRQKDSAVLWHLGANPAKPSPVANDPAQKTAREMTVTPGFQIDVIAAEPAISQPIAFCIDERGRLWVVEGHSYPNKRKEGEGLDNIVILADEDGNGHFEKRTLFMEKLNLVSGIEVGMGGVFIGAAPHLLFVPDRNRDDKPDSAPEVLLDGWGWQDTHETLNSFTWGPDGWLYGNQGVFTHSKVGAPGTPDDQRLRFNAGVWRFHPQQKRFELFATGGSNQWGIDFNSVGDGFMTHCRSYHGGGGTSHIIRNAHFWNQTNNGHAPFISGNAPGFAPGVKNFLPAAAKYDSGEGGAGKPGTNAVYGGHSHVGTMVYLGDNWPEIYRDRIFTLNLHGAQLNHQEAFRQGSGYEVFHAGYDLFHSTDPQYLGVDLQYGPDGAAYISDWADKQHCHTTRDEQWDRSNGRFYRLSWAATYKPVKVDLGAMSDAELVALHTHRNEWHVRTARRLLQDRAATGKTNASAFAPLLAAISNPDAVTALRALWTLHVTRQATDPVIGQALSHPDDRVRAWAIHLGTEHPGGLPCLNGSAVVDLATKDPSATVRRALASALPMFTEEIRWKVGAALAAHGEDASDRFLPKLIWQGLAPLCEKDIARALTLAGTTPLADLADSIRWFASRSPQGRSLISADLVAAPQEQAERRLRLMAFTIEREASLPMPDGWAAAAARFASGATADVVRQLNAVFGDQTVLAAERAALADEKAPLQRRQAAFALLKRVGDREAVPTYVKLLNDGDFRSAVIPLVGGSNDPAVATSLISAYPTLSASEKAAALTTLASKAAFAKPLVDAVAAKAFPKQDVSASHQRQLRTLNDPAITAVVETLWGKLNESPAAAKASIAKYRKLFGEKPLWAYSAQKGKEVFTRICAACHQMNGTGGKLGPDLSGSWSNGVDYFIENIVDPNSVIGPDFQLNLISLKDGAIVSGMVAEETQGALVVRTLTDTITVQKDNIANRTVSPASMMPPGLLDTLSESEAIDLLKFLSSKP